MIDMIERDNVVVAKFEGDVDMGNVDALTTNVLGEVANDAHGLVCDMRAVRYLDSAGVQMLFQFTRRLGTCRQSMAIVIEPDSPLWSLIKITHLDEAAHVGSSVDDAVAEINDRWTPGF